MKRNMKKIIIFNPSDQRILFLLVAAIKAGYSPTYGYSAESLWGTTEEIIFLNIDPDTDLKRLGSHPDLDAFLAFKVSNIKAWLKFPKEGGLDKNNPSVRNILEHFSPEMEKDSLALNNPDKWIKGSRVERYGKALHAAKVLSLNKKDLTKYQEILLSAAYSIAEGRNNINIDSYLMQYQRIVDVTEFCFKKINVKQKLIHLPHKKIAFGYLDNVSDYLDFSDLRDRCLFHYPFLTIIQYRQNGEEYTWFMSKGQLNIQKVFQLPKYKNKHEQLIVYPHSKMLLHLKEAIEGITKR